MHWHGGWGKAKYTVPYGHWLHSTAAILKKKIEKRNSAYIFEGPWVSISKEI